MKQTYSGDVTVVRCLLTSGPDLQAWIVYLASEECWSYYHKSRRAYTFVTRGSDRFKLSYVKGGRVLDTRCCVLIKPNEDLAFAIGTSTVLVKGPIKEAGDLLVTVDGSRHVLKYSQGMVLGRNKKIMDNKIVPRFALWVQKNTSDYGTNQLKKQWFESLRSSNSAWLRP